MGIVASVLRTFHGGVHPKEYKELSEHCAIEALPVPKQLFVPLHQHIGQPCEPCVTVGQKVLKGDLIGRATGFVSAPIHAPTSGIVTAIQGHSVGHPSGLTLPSVVIDPDGNEQWSDEHEGIKEPFKASPDDIRKKIREAGIVGLGGATFPSFIKMSPPKGKVVELLLINGVECEPYLTCDARLMEERAREIISGIRIMMHALQTKLCVIGIEDNKPGAIRTMMKASDDSPEIKVTPLPVLYPQGSEKQLIEVVTGRQVPSGKLPIEVGVIVHNVATAIAIRDAVMEGRPLVSRVVTITGKGVVKPANLECLLGTPIKELIDYCGGLKAGVKKIVMGGPMMGVALRDLTVPVVKGTSGLLALLQDEISDKPEQPCIRCGHCVGVCPISLVPLEMAWLSKSDQFDALSELNLFDCVECGTCAYVCPSSVPLVHYFRYGKISILAQRQAQRQGELDKARSKAKEVRVAAEKAAKEAKKAAMKAKMAATKAAKEAKAQAAKEAAAKTAEEAKAQAAKDAEAQAAKEAAAKTAEEAEATKMSVAETIELAEAIEAKKQQTTAPEEPVKTTPPDAADAAPKPSTATETTG